VASGFTTLIDALLTIEPDAMSLVHAGQDVAHVTQFGGCPPSSVGGMRPWHAPHHLCAVHPPRWHAQVAIYEFKKKKYGRQFPTHDDRHNALLEYLRADDVDKLLEHAHECNMARRQGQGDVYGQDTSLSSNDSYITSQPTVSKKKDSKKSSSKHRKAHGGSSGGDR